MSFSDTYWIHCWAMVAKSYRGHVPVQDEFRCLSEYQLKSWQSESPSFAVEELVGSGPSTKLLKRKRGKETENNNSVVKYLEASLDYFLTCMFPEIKLSQEWAPRLVADDARSSEGPIDFVSLAAMRRVIFPKLVQHGCAPQDLFNCICRVKSNSGCDGEADIMGSRYILPSDSTFLLSDISCLEPLVHEASNCGGYNLVVVDPPWENASARRSSSYITMPPKRLFQLPLRQIMPLQGQAIVALWLTNRKRVHNFARHQLLPQWGLEEVGLWYWLKVTDQGRPVSSLRSLHRHPYEQLLIARPVRHLDPSGNADRAPPADGSPPAREPSDPPSSLTIIATPAQHSRKPRIGHLLAPYLPEGCRPLELFARELERGWTSWGDEVLKFQHESHFVRLAEAQPAAAAAAPAEPGSPPQPPEGSARERGAPPEERGAPAGEEALPGESGGGDAAAEGR
uniref:Methyltransferase-like protein 4 n=1 Tax=Tetraselmis sp. GSL018 TaxID=582737 RepID=A0A061S4K4_9CHLO|mmetsp:Transcript_11107/g.26354  ORF Transcript_11107/g.26354 Transcript_11107/m.26354 type:complete len:454 (-) Transcript_11107:54-1415(-)